jgi:ABC-type amino acid transport system permease subunit
MQSIVRFGVPAFSFLIVIASFAFFLSRSGTEMSALTEEDGLFEVATVVELLIASALFGYAFWLSVGHGQRLWLLRTRRNLVLLGLALVLFVAAGEELSWGQHILGFETPAFIAENNEQDEFNLHNLSPFDQPSGADERRLLLITGFSALVLGLGVAFPLLHTLFPIVRRLNKRLGIPVAPLWMPLFLLLTVVFARTSPPLPPDAKAGALSEVREAAYAYSLVAMAFYVALAERSAIRDT